jgi:hypothetical protein
MKPLGQIEAAERMIQANCYSGKMAKALFTITKPELVHSVKSNRATPGTSAKLDLLQQEADSLLIDVKQVEDTYAATSLDLTLGLGYVEHLLSNPRIDKFLAKHHPEILSEFKKQIEEKAEEMSRPIPGSTTKLRPLPKATQKKSVQSEKGQALVAPKPERRIRGRAAAS